VLAGGAIDLDTLVKLESEARRGVSALDIKSGPPPHTAGTVSVTLTENESKY
jgi:hypothetical protein